MRCNDFDFWVARIGSKFRICQARCPGSARKVQDGPGVDHCRGPPAVRRWRWLLRVQAVWWIRARRRFGLGSNYSSPALVVRGPTYPPVICASRHDQYRTSAGPEAPFLAGSADFTARDHTARPGPIAQAGLTVTFVPSSPFRFPTTRFCSVFVMMLSPG